MINSFYFIIFDRSVEIFIYIEHSIIVSQNTTLSMFKPKSLNQ